MLELEDLSDEVVGYADCYSKGPGFESRVSHGPFQKVNIGLTIQSCKKLTMSRMTHIRSWKSHRLTHG
jgi:hypothetical protein